MLNRLYWLITATVVAVAVHAAYMLIAPGVALERSITAMGAVSARNVFRVLRPEEQLGLFPAYPASNVIGVCAFDVSKGSIELSANMPDGFWTLTIYSRRGGVIYALNSEQSGTKSFTVSLSKAPGLIESLLQTSGDDPGNFTGWKVATADPQGIAVLWVPAWDPAQRAAITGILERSRCQTAT